MEIARRYKDSTLWRKRRDYGFAWSRTKNWQGMPTEPAFWHNSKAVCQKQFIEDQDRKEEQNYE